MRSEAAVAWPLAARAQQPGKLPTIGDPLAFEVFVDSGIGEAPCSSQATDGKTWIPLASGLAGGSYELQVPNLPTKSAKLKLERTVPYSVTITSGFFTIAA